MNLSLTIQELSWPQKLLLGTLLTLISTVMWTAAHSVTASAYTISGTVVYGNTGSAQFGRVFPSSCANIYVNGINRGNPAGASGYSGNPTVNVNNGVSSFSCWGQTYSLWGSAYCINAVLGSGCPDGTGTVPTGVPHWSTLASRSPVAPTSQLDFRWWFTGPEPPQNYSVQGVLLFDGSNWFPSGYGFTQAWSDGGGSGSGYNNSFNYPSLAPGNPHMTAPATITYSGKTYSLESSSNPGANGTYTSVFCYNSTVNSPTNCSNGTTPSQDSSGLTQRNPADPNNIAHSGAPFIDIRWYYASPRYNVTGSRVYNSGSSTFPSGTGSTTVTVPGWNDTTGNNPFSLPPSGAPYQGLANIWSASYFTYNSIVYNLVGYTGHDNGNYGGNSIVSTLCYNSTVTGQNSCSNGSGASAVTLSQLPAPNYQRQPGDPTSLPGGPPYKIDTRTYYEPACSSFVVYALDDTATLKYAIQNNSPWTPYQGPPQGGGFPSRAHVATNISSSYSGGFSSGCNGYYTPPPDNTNFFQAFPSSTATHYCAAGSSSCPEERTLYMPPADTSKPTMSPPGQIAADGNHPLLTFVGNSGNSSGVSIELGTSGQQVTSSRKFPDPSQIQNPPGSDYRLIYHYVDCSDSTLQNSVYCPIPAPTCQFVPPTALTVNYGDTITLNWTIQGTLTGEKFDPGNMTLANGTTSRQVTVTGNTTYVVTVSNSAGSTSCSRQINLQPPSCGPSPISVNTNDPVNLQGYGGNNSYSWTATGSDTPTFTTTGTNQRTIHYASAAGSPYSVRVDSNSAFAICQVIVTVPPYHPYVRIYGGDAAAGSGLGSTCKSYVTAADPAQIHAYNNGSGIGAGAQFAAFALSTIDGFSSASDRPTSSPPPIPPNGLTFSNTSGSPPYFGNFNTAAGATLFCATDYPVPTTGTSPAPLNSAGGTQTDVGLLTDGAYTTGATTINGTTGIANSRKVAIYATGNVVITGNKIYYANADVAGGWLVADDIPSFYLIVRGANIYIDSSVRQLDGVYVALPNESTGLGGTIYTCTSGGSLFTSATLHTNCNNQLVINGAFLAKQIKFQRSLGDISNSNIAEVFNFGPELWFRAPAAGPPSSTTSGTTYDSIISLPPVL